MAARNKVVEVLPGPGVPLAVRDDVRAAEAAGQRAACHIPAGDLPADLAEALDRRVAANLAATSGHPLQSCGGADPDVMRLEAPYKPQPADSADSDEPPSALDDTTNPEGER